MPSTARTTIILLDSINLEHSNQRANRNTVVHGRQQVTIATLFDAPDAGVVIDHRMRRRSYRVQTGLGNLVGLE
jgi:hypothetical protein